MPCGGCARRREAIKTAWMRVKGYMTNDARTMDQIKARQDRLAAEARQAAHDAIKARQVELTARARRRAF